MNINYLMSLFKLDKVLLVALITAFLTMQWTTAHIHLAAHHNHDGSYHQHEVTAHAHQSNGHHVNVIDSASQEGGSNVVALDCECHVPNGKKLEEQLAGLAAADFGMPSFFQFSGVIFSDDTGVKLNYISYSTVRLRAPPAAV